MKSVPKKRMLLKSHIVSILIVCTKPERHEQVSHIVSQVCSIHVLSNIKKGKSFLSDS